LNGLYRRRDIAGVEAYLQNMAENGVNILRIMLEYAHVNTRFFERPAGRFNPSMVRLWDDLFARCERFGIRVLLAPWDNYWLALRWRHHPYNVANGGPGKVAASVLPEEETIAATIRRLQFVVKRWGGCGAFAAWDLFNEIHPHYGGTPKQQGDSSRAFRGSARGRVAHVGLHAPADGFHLWPRTGRRLRGTDLRHPCLDFASTHIYHRSGIDRPNDTVVAARTMAQWVRYGLERTPRERPSPIRNTARSTFSTTPRR
jgi:mannan endo-1,4-beta-mannosidase